MKPGGPGQRATGSGSGKPSFKSSRLPALPMEWMDPMSWRLPSGKALAEFALQAGFLAPLMLSGPQVKRVKKAPVAVPVGPEKVGAVGSQVAVGSQAVGSQAEEPERSGTFRKTR
jgi:hypothetical protein